MPYSCSASRTELSSFTSCRGLKSLVCTANRAVLFLQRVFENPPKWSTYSAGMAGATGNCCRLGESSVYTIQPCTMQSHIRKVHACLAVTCYMQGSNCVVCLHLVLLVQSFCSIVKQRKCLLLMIGETRPSLSLNQPTFEDVPLVKSVYAVFTRMPGESYRGRFSFGFCMC